MQLPSCLRALPVALPFLIAIALPAQDSRKVTEPRIPAACVTLKAQIAAPGGVIAEADEGFEVHEWTADGVAPWTVYPTKEAAASRLLQLMGIKHAIVPQAYPEDVCVDAIQIAKQKDT